MAAQTSIPGDYQYRALRRGPRLQRFWHRHKLTVMGLVLPLEAGGVVLDVGCGSGNLTFEAARRSRLAIGVDTSLEAVRFCHHRSSRGRTAFLAAAAGELPLPDQSVDCALLVEVIEHLADPPPVLAELQRVLLPGGRLLVTTPNYGPGSLWPLLERLADASGLVARMAAEQHVQAYSPAGLAAELRRSGFQVTRLGTFYRKSLLVALLCPGRAGRLVAAEVASGRLDGALIYALATVPTGQLCYHVPA